MLTFKNRLTRIGRPPCTMGGISKRLLRTQIVQLVAKIESDGVTDCTLYEVGRLLRSLDRPRIPGMSVFPQLYVMSVLEREGTYKTTLDPYLEVELVGPSIGDAVFDGMRTVLEESYGLRVKVPGEYKWNILRGDMKVGSLAYDTKEAHRVPSLRTTLKGRTIAFCYRRAGLVAETKVVFNPAAKRRQIRSEVLPPLRRKEEEFMRMLRSRPSDFFKHIEEHE